VHLPQGATGQPEVVAQVDTADAERALEVLDLLPLPLRLDAGDEPISRITAHGYLFGNSAAYDGRAPSGARTLRDDPAFSKAVPNRDQASLIGYLNIASIMDADESISAKDRADWKHLGAVGLSWTPRSEGNSLTIRVTTR
jgi:hypothetical protein